jgi:60 kDa SS-A/Ro ribonucleoprotein
MFGNTEPETPQKESEMADALSSFNLRVTPQSQSARTDQVKNSAGGHVFAVTPLTRLRRFLTLGTSGGSYYVGERELTRGNAQIVVNYAQTDPATLVQEIVAVSQAGRAPKNDQALFALAIAAAMADEDGKKAALAALPLVARTGTHLFQFAGYVEQFRGWGRGLRRAVGAWYTGMPVDALAYQAAKYQNRAGWSHRDLLRLAHPATDTAARKALFDWICGRESDLSGLPLIEGFAKAHQPGANLPQLILDYGLSWEMLPSERLNDADVWGALLHRGLPQTALMRQLPRLTNLGLLHPLGDHIAGVTAQLTDPAKLAKARVHPINVLMAQRTYSGGQSLRGQSTWTPVAQVTDALDAAFYAAFGAVPATNMRHLLALDVSGSMTQAISGMPLSCREASAALALVTANVEPLHQIVGFTAGAASRRGGYGYGQGWRENTALTPLNISSKMRLNDAIGVVSRLSFGGTDCALPITEALRNKTLVDVFSVYTDNETWAGSIHPFQALRQYRAEINPNAKLVVVGMTATPFTIADPSDAGMLDIAGFDSATPNLIADFARGDL